MMREKRSESGGEARSKGDERKGGAKGRSKAWRKREE
jgi:hypothetical protein